MKYFNEENGPLKIIFDHDEIKASYELPWDASADEILNAVKSAMIALTYQPETFENTLVSWLEDRGYYIETPEQQEKGEENSTSDM